ncbi:MAG: WG repeat-containing protein [Balneolaceae bacterium]|nr:WG repeat-containing protein [Balneolaceae bacterium]
MSYKKYLITASVLLLLFAGCSSLKKTTESEVTLLPYIEDEKVGFVDTSMATQIAPQFKFIPDFNWPYHFSQDLAAINIMGKVGYVNRKGDLVIKPRFDRGHNFSGGLAPG